MNRLLLLALACAVFTLGCSATAYADDIVCMTADGAPLDSTCSETYTLTKAGFEVALQVADAGVVHAGPTTLKLGPGTLELADPVTVSQPVTGDALTIAGSGREQTKIQSTFATSGSSFTMLTIPSPFGQNTTIRDLELKSSLAISLERLVAASGGTFQNLRVSVIGGQESQHFGLSLSGDDATVTGTEFTIMGIAAHAVSTSAPLTITDSSFSTPTTDFDEQFGLSSAGGLTARRLRFSGLYTAVDLAGNGAIDDTLIEVGSVSGSDGVIYTGAPTTDDDSQLRMRGMTIVGDHADQFGITGMFFPTGAGPSQRTLRFEDSIVHLTGPTSNEVRCAAGANTVGHIESDHSIVNMETINDLIGAQCSIDATTMVSSYATPPKFVDAANGDFRPTVDSPAIDFGNSDSDRTPPKIDLAGNPRFVDGDGNGTAILDSGALEYQLPIAPPPAPPAEPGPPALTIALGKPTGKFKIKKRRPRPFTVVPSTTKPRIPVTVNRDTAISLGLLKYRGGFRSGKRCVSRKPRRGRARRCDLALKGSLQLNLKAGASFISFSGKWGRKKLAPGRYVLTATSPASKDAPKSVLSVIR